MTDNAINLWAQIVALAVCMPVYFGFLLYAYWGPNKKKLQALAEIPFHEDEWGQP